MESDETLDRMIDAAALALGLTLPEGSRAAIRSDLSTILEHGRICEASLEGATVEIAPVYRP